MVELYLIRHAVAEERGDAWPDDAQRPLTDVGRTRMRKVAQGLARVGIGLDVILTSPLVRARQTADIVAAAFKHPPAIVAFDALSPETPHADIVAGLRRYGRKKRVALVGHEPDLGQLAGRLLGMKTPVPFKKGAVCRIDVSKLPPTAPGTLQWFATPAMLRAMRK
ncbi:MAG: phosphohistidine phosphatase SixA [Acidobacteria bacterium]|nr:phosphohistidine phosphatase SixA [Acidobacteriota bacterium]